MYKVGDKVVSVCIFFRGETGIVVRFLDNDRIGIRFGSFMAYQSPTDCHSMDLEEIISEEIYNSPLYRALKEN